MARLGYAVAEEIRRAVEAGAMQREVARRFGVSECTVSDVVRCVRWVAADGRAKDLERFMEKVTPEPNTGCWLWTGAVRSNGYGAFALGGRLVSAHRAAFGVFGLTIPHGRVVDHRCRVRCCVNPAHLDLVTQRTNILRGESQAAVVARTGVCSNGHALVESNVYRVPKKGWRRCVACRREHDRKRSPRVRVERLALAEVAS